MNTTELREETCCSGRVIGLGPSARSASLLYARLTRRPCQQATNIDDLALSCHDVLVCCTSELTARLMYKLYVTGASAGVPGLMIAPTSKSLETVCLSQAAKVDLPNRSSGPRRIFVNSRLNHRPIERGVDVFISGSHPSDDLVSRLSSGASILVLHGHGDGIDMSISSRQYLCPFLDTEGKSHPGWLAPRCQVLGRCTRVPTRPEIVNAKNEGWILPLSVLRAQIGVVLSCNAVRLQDGVIDSCYGLAAALLQQANFRAIITTWRLEGSAEDASQLNTLINDLSSGTMVGVAVASFNRSDIAAQFGTRLCVVGDPCVAIKPDPSFLRLPQMTVSETKSNACSFRADRPETSLLRDAVLRSIRVNPAFDVCQANALALKLSSYGIVTSSNEEQTASSAESIDSELLNFLKEAPWLRGFFGHFAQQEPPAEHGVCPACSAPARSWQLTFPEYAAGGRSIITCACCGETLDKPSEWHLQLNLDRIKEGMFVVSGIPTGAQIQVCLVHLQGALHQAYACPNAETQESLFRLPSPLPPLPLFCRILLANKLKIGSIGFRFRQLSDRTYRTIGQKGHIDEKPLNLRSLNNI